MVKPALAARRAVMALDHLASRAGEPRTLTEICAATGVNPASMLSVLAALTDGGYLVRHPAHKTYTLGPALVAVGHAALSHDPTIAAARDELSLLGEEVRAQCAAAVVMGDELVAVVVEGRPRSRGTWTPVGARVPFAPPYGAPFAAFGPVAQRARWLSAHPDQRPATLAALDATLGAIRDRGYVRTAEDDLREPFAQAVTASAQHPADESRRARMHELLAQLVEGFVATNGPDAPDGAGNVSHVIVPVLSPAGDAVMDLTAGGFPDPLDAAGTERVARRLQASAEVIAATAFGRG